MDELPTIIDILKIMPEEYRKAFYARALALEIEAWQMGQFDLWRLYGQVTDAYLDAFGDTSDVEALELEDFEVVLGVGGDD